MSTYHGLLLRHIDIRYLPEQKMFAVLIANGEMVGKFSPDEAKAVMKFLGGSLADLKRHSDSDNSER